MLREILVRPRILILINLRYNYYRNETVIRGAPQFMKQTLYFLPKIRSYVFAPDFLVTGNSNIETSHNIRPSVSMNGET